MYGETEHRLRRREGQLGLSPHVRGNHELPTSDMNVVGSIPACTGKPAATVNKL